MLFPFCFCLNLYSCVVFVFYFFFFFKQKTAYKLRISDWSSDVCSSDLSFDLKEPTDRAALGNFIVKAAQDLKSPLHFLRHAAIAERWQQHRANFWDRTGRPKGADESIDWDGMEQASLDRCLIAMRQRQMVFSSE